MTLPYFPLGVTSFVYTFGNKISIIRIAGVVQDLMKYIWSNLPEWGEGEKGKEKSHFSLFIELFPSYSDSMVYSIYCFIFSVGIYADLNCKLQ